MKNFYLITAMLVSFSANAISIPSHAPSPSGYDEVRTSTGTSCRSNIGGNLQIHGGLVDGNSSDEYNYGNSFQDESAAYVGFSYSFGSGARVRCDRLAEIETEKAELELQKLRDEIESLKKIRELKLMQESGLLPKIELPKK